MLEHPNLERTRNGFAAFAAGDLGPLADLIHEDAVWHVGGSNVLAREYHGRNEIFGLFRRTAELTGGTYRVEPLWALADDEHVAVVYRARGERDGRTIDIEQVLLVTVEGGYWLDVVAVPTDQRAFDDFWS